MGKNDFFLEPDDAQTLGDINYMKKSVRVRRTFPKTLKNKDGFAIEKQVSAMEDIDLSDRNRVSQSNGFSATNTESNGTTAQPQTNISQSNFSADSRKTDTNMDMFLNMARNIKKRK